MSYLSDFERSFIDHTLALVETYQGPYSATLMINCLLGLLVLPKEQYLEHVPEEPLINLDVWGISPASIQNSGRPTKANPKPDTLRGLVSNLRHSIAHFKVRPWPATSEVQRFEYTNDSGLHASISLEEMRRFVQRLSAHLAKQ